MFITKEIEFYCIGHYTLEKNGYYSGCDTVDNFRVFLNHSDVTDAISKNLRDELEADFLAECRAEREPSDDYDDTEL
jgi:hypothetical protein